MNPLLKTVAFALGAIAITIGSYVTIGALTGTPMSDLPGIKAFVPAPPQAPVVESREVPSVREELAQDRRGQVHVYEAASTPLKAFLMESPFDGSELQALEDRLQSRLEELDRRAEKLDARERELEQSFAHVETMYAEIEALRTEVFEERATVETRADEVDANDRAQKEREAQWLETAASIYAEGKAKTSAGMLLAGKDAGQVARILNELGDERRRELMGAIHDLDPEQYVAVEAALRAL